MKSLHDFLRNRLLQAAGIFEKCPEPKSLKEIIRIQSCPSFEKLRENRMVMGYFRYGSLSSQIGKAKYDNTGSIQTRLSQYLLDHNREHLVDIANLAMIEFATHPDYPFKAGDDTLHTQKKGRE